MDAKRLQSEVAGRGQLIDRVLETQRAIGRALQANAGPLWSQLDLTMSQMKALQVIAHGGPLPIGGLAQVLGVGNPAASLLVDALVRQGLVIRAEDPLDRRRTLATLSAQGRDLVERLQGNKQCLIRWLLRLSDEDLAGLAQGLQALLAVAAADPSSSDYGAPLPAEDSCPGLMH